MSQDQSPHDSPRIHALRDAVAAQDLGRIAAAGAALDMDDRAALADRTRAKAFWDLVEHDLGGFAHAPHRAAIESALTSTEAPTGPQTYTVERGDTLSKIAKRFLGEARRYPEIVALNKDRIKDPDRIQVGWTLTLPPR